MGLISLWDLISAGAISVCITGFSFMLGSEPYRDDSRRHILERNLTTDAAGGTGQRFEKCSALAAHGPAINRRFAMGLSSSGRIIGDSYFSSAISMTDSEYLNELDQSYGVPCY